MFQTPGQSSGTHVNMWDSLLKSVSSASRRAVSSKTLVLLGGDASGAQDFVATLRFLERRSTERKRKKVQHSTRYDLATTYTYVDIEDNDGEEVLARLNVYTVPSREPAFIPLLQDFMQRQPLEDTIVCVLLDWTAPEDWVKQLKYWIQHVKQIQRTLCDSDPNLRKSEEHFSDSWSMRLRTYNQTAKSSSSSFHIDPRLAPPLSAGQFEDSLGMPLLCVVQQANIMDTMEQEQGIKDAQFDFMQQILRTVLMKHGAALIYTTPAQPETTQRPLLSLLKDHIPSVYKELNVIDILNEAITLDRDQVYVPAGWDSWAKISVLREGFEPEDIAARWTVECHAESETSSDAGLVRFYEEAMREVIKTSITTSTQVDKFVPMMDPNILLEKLEQIQLDEERKVVETSVLTSAPAPDVEPKRPQIHDNIMRDGDEVDVDELDAKLKSLRERRNHTPSQPSTPSTPGPTGKSGTDRDEYVHAFFQNLLTRSNSSRPEIE